MFEIISLPWINRLTINAFKWRLRRAGASKRFANQAAEYLIFNQPMDIELPNGRSFSVRWN